MARGKSNPDTVAAQREVERAERAARNKAASDAATGRGGGNPGPPSEAWARKRGLIG